MRKLKRIAVCLLAALMVTAFVGCDKGAPVTDNIAVFKIEKDACSVAEAKLLLMNYQNQYRDVYGVDLWKATGEENQELESYIKDLTISQLAEIYMMAYIGHDQELELSEEEQAHVKEAATAYYTSLNEAELTWSGVSEKDVLNLYEHYAMARKVYAELTANVDTEISDDEARVMSLLQIYTETEEYMNLAYKKLQGGSEFSAVAAAYNQADETSIKADRRDVPKEAEEAVFALTEGSYTPVIEAADGYYIYYCENNYEEELTEKNKASVLKQRMEEAVNTTYDTYAASTDSKLDEERWQEVHVNTEDSITTTGFFTVFEEYCGNDYR